MSRLMFSFVVNGHSARGMFDDLLSERGRGRIVEAGKGAKKDEHVNHLSNILWSIAASGHSTPSSLLLFRSVAARHKKTNFLIDNCPSYNVMANILHCFAVLNCVGCCDDSGESSAIDEERHLVSSLWGAINEAYGGGGAPPPPPLSEFALNQLYEFYVCSSVSERSERAL